MDSRASQVQVSHGLLGENSKIGPVTTPDQAPWPGSIPKTVPQRTTPRLPQSVREAQSSETHLASDTSERETTEVFVLHDVMVLGVANLGRGGVGMHDCQAPPLPLV